MSAELFVVGIGAWLLFRWLRWEWRPHCAEVEVLESGRAETALELVRSEAAALGSNSEFVQVTQVQHPGASGRRDVR
jgi:hypothetical protein